MTKKANYIFIANVYLNVCSNWKEDDENDKTFHKNYFTGGDGKKEEWKRGYCYNHEIDIEIAFRG